ncbi:MAG: Mur ligase family protein [Acidimicrobiia bacterium]
MTYDEAVAWLDGHAWRGVRPGLERMAGVLELLDDPHRAYPVVHVAGTNGKTTVTRLVSALVAGHGLVPGTFISPHLHRVEERFAVGLETPTPDDFVAIVEEVRPIIDLYEQRAGEGPTYFELTALLAFARFAAETVDVGVIEVGMGGRLDATNVVEPAVAVVTSIGLDHTEVLGDDVATIAGEKLGILKPGAVLVTGDLPDPAAAVAEARAAEVGTPHLRFGVDFDIADAQIAVGGWSVHVAGVHAEYEDLFLPLHGRHQVENLAVAVAATEALFDRALSPDDLSAAVAGFDGPGRLEVLARDPLVVADGAHNPDGIEVVAEALASEFAVDRWVVVFGAMRDKDLRSMLTIVGTFADHLVVTAVDDRRAASPEDLATMAADVTDVEVTAVAEPAAALARATELAGPTDGVVILGSLYLVGAIDGRA